MHVAWKIWFVGGACFGAFFAIVLVDLLTSPPPSPGDPSIDVMMGPVLMLIMWGISSLCVWNTLRTARKYTAGARFVA